MKRKRSIIFILLILAIPVGQWLMSVTSPNLLFEHRLPPGQWYYLFSKLTAQYAFLLLALQVILGSVLAVASNIDWLTPKFHRNVGLCLLTFVVLHVGLFAYAVWLRSGYFPVALFTLRFDQGYYKFFISFGLISAFLLVLVALIGIGRQLFPALLFRYGHKLAWVAWNGGVLHSFAIGSETNSGQIWSIFYGLGIVIVVTMACYRLIKGLKSRQTVAAV